MPCCSICPIPQLDDIDALSRDTLSFASAFDHPAHAGYRDALLLELLPVLTYGTLSGFLRRKEVIFEVYQELDREREEKARGEAERSHGH